MLKNNSRIESIKKEMDSIQEEGAKQEGNHIALQVVHIIRGGRREGGWWGK